MIKNFRASLRTKIIFMSLSLCALMAAGGLISLQKLAGSYDTTFYKNQKDLAASLAEKISAQFFERYGDVHTYVKLYGIYDVILVVDRDGNYVGSNTKDTADKNINIANLKSMNFKDAPWFSAAIKGQWTADKAKGFDQTFVEDIQLDPMYDFASGEQKTGCSFTTVVKSESGEVVGVITNRVNNRWIEGEMKDVFLTMKDAGFDDAEVTLLNHEGYVLSNLAPKTHGDKIEFDKDLDKIILKENFFKNHHPAGAKMAKHESGSMRSTAAGEDEDLIGFNFIDTSKFTSSLGWTVAVHIDAGHAFHAETSALSYFYILTGLFSLVSLMIAVWFGFSTSKSINSIISVLAENSSEVSGASTKIAAQSTELSEAATEQAAALQETVAAVDEINAMVEKNAEAAEKSKVTSASSRETATAGQQTVQNMITAVNDINLQNEEISQQMEATNNQLTDITKLINDIGTKTKVINEIVFQTKLLSFNASVEAARAGEYGKGFAVVAEEVGNLAQMSGSAAKEITELLEQSIRQVEGIISATKSRVEKLMDESRKKVEVGSQTAKECNEMLIEILEQVSMVDSLVAEIAVASKEQSMGIREISTAVGQMEQVTQQNSSVAQSSSVSGEQLQVQSRQLDGLVQDLVSIVSGSGQRAERATPSLAHKQDDRSNVLNLKKKSSMVSKGLEKESVDYKVKKKAVGSEFVPSSDDPGFEE
jgi:methyl-accepting chemotaxis protein